MAKLPAFQFYPGDWLKDAALRRCSPAARGMWIDVLCLMFECEDRGVLATGGIPWTDDEVAAAVAGDTSANLLALRELLAKGVCSRLPSGALCSRRMVRDEELRRIKAASGTAGGKQKASKRSSKPPSKRLAKAKQPPEDEDEVEDEVETETELETEDEAAQIPRTKISPVDLVIAHYCKFHPRAQAGGKERAKISSRLKEGYTVADLQVAIDGCHVSPWHCGQNDDGRKYQTLELIVRDSSKVNQFIEMAAKNGGPQLSARSQRTIENLHRFVLRQTNAAT